MAKILKDRLSVEDRLAQARAKHPQTLWARTRVIGGYGLTRNQYGISALDEVVFDDENIGKRLEGKIVLICSSTTHEWSRNDLAMRACILARAAKENGAKSVVLIEISA